MESRVDKTFVEGVQDTPSKEPVKDWFGMSPQSVFNVVGKDISGLHADRDACKGSTDTPKGATLRTMETLEPPML
ncbi:MAG: hypothetical protein ACP5SF_02850 [Thermoplasmata archaeon]